MLLVQFYIYNASLRRYPADVVESFSSFATTIYVLCSAVNKLAKSVKIPNTTLLYRGLGRMAELPDSFRSADDRGRTGYVEWGFLSTTSNKEIAMQYSGVKEGNLKAMVIEFPTTSIDRGGCVEAFSQYPKVLSVDVFCMRDVLIERRIFCNTICCAGGGVLVSPVLVSAEGRAVSV